VPQGEFASLVAWLDGRLGQRVWVSMMGPQERETSVALHTEGELRRADGEILLIDPAPGEVVRFDVGNAVIILLEGDLFEVEFEDAETVASPDGGTFEKPESALADFGELTVHFRVSSRETR
jgi:hypothetical protein